ncbi:delta-class carbonic anhydrase [Pseudophaeobacter arcticus]|uniref:delta-class carbonic anhydrase n=1 Tax=Pseudophaeobacter arcticus TaxID=385492 RepID=UPI00040E150F|nr:delta-class carbonic anhydrase [Pseudophaeobacter arcticus]
MQKPISLIAASLVTMAAWNGGAHAASEGHGGEAEAVPNSVVETQRAHLLENTLFAGFGPQSPRDIDSPAGTNHVEFEAAPPYTEMNLCNIHFHENAEHRGGEFTTFAGNGDGHGYGSGYKYSGTLSPAELMPLEAEVGVTEHGSLVPGDTIEVHYVHTTARVDPGPTLGSCLSEAIKNPQLRVEAQVYVLVNDETALDFTKLTRLQQQNGLTQAINIPTNTGPVVEYSGSTTGPSYNEKGSPFQVTWGVRPKVAKVSIQSVAKWLSYNRFDEDHAHGVRNLVINRDLLSVIEH